MEENCGFYMPAEWAPREATFMSWPVREGLFLSGLEEAREGWAEVANAISEHEKLIMICPDANHLKKRLSREIELWELPYDDSWIRDNGPTIVLGPLGYRAGVNWHFNAWGEKYHPWAADDALAGLILERLNMEKIDAPLVLEGGSIHVDGEGTLLSTRECLLNPNRNPLLPRERIEHLLGAYLGVDTVIWLERGLVGDETDGHIDNVACFVSPGLVALQLSSNPDDPNYLNGQENLSLLSSAADSRGRKLTVVALEQPPHRAFDGKPLTLSYVNYYPVNGALIVPFFGLGGDTELSRLDDHNRGILGELYPDRQIVGIDGLRIAKGGGNVHCITQQLPASRSCP